MVEEAVTGGPGFRIKGIGMAVPERVVGNLEIAERLGVDASWIESRTGILERRYVEPGESSATLGARAARQALERSGISANQIDVIIAATCTPDHQFPSTACLIQHDLGADSAGAFDLSAACSGFIYSLAVGAGLAGGGDARRVLIVGVDILSRHIDFDDPITAPLFGDGAGAVVLEGDDTLQPLRFSLGADGSGGERVLIPAGGSRLPASIETVSQRLHCIRMNGREVYRAAVRTMSTLGAELVTDGFELLVAHQANRRILVDCASCLGVDMSKVFVNINRYGNTSGASIPLALCEAWEGGHLKEADRVLMLAF
ncbi:MAG: 3-oxoacyl-ACP synthase III family protein, partial [Actinomycetota bacterium]